MQVAIAFFFDIYLFHHNFSTTEIVGSAIVVGTTFMLGVFRYIGFIR